MSIFFDQQLYEFVLVSEQFREHLVKLPGICRANKDHPRNFPDLRINLHLTLAKNARIIDQNIPHTHIQKCISLINDKELDIAQKQLLFMQMFAKPVNG